MKKVTSILKNNRLHLLFAFFITSPAVELNGMYRGRANDESPLTKKKSTMDNANKNKLPSFSASAQQKIDINAVMSSENNSSHTSMDNHVINKPIGVYPVAPTHIPPVVEKPITNSNKSPENNFSTLSVSFLYLKKNVGIVRYNHTLPICTHSDISKAAIEAHPSLTPGGFNIMINNEKLLEQDSISAIVLRDCNTVYIAKKETNYLYLKKNVGIVGYNDTLPICTHSDISKAAIEAHPYLTPGGFNIMINNEKLLEQDSISAIVLGDCNTVYIAKKETN